MIKQPTGDDDCHYTYGELWEDSWNIPGVVDVAYSVGMQEILSVVTSV